MAAKIAGEEWKNMTEKQRGPYEEELNEEERQIWNSRADEAMEAYKKELGDLCFKSSDVNVAAPCLSPICILTCTYTTVFILMAPPPKPDPFSADSQREADAGAVFVLQSRGEWWHAGFHLTTAIVGPTILTLPCSTTAKKDGRRHIRFRELAADVLGSGWMFYFVIFIQTAINTGVGIGAILLAGECLQIMYSSLSPDGPLKLYEFIAMVTVVMIVLSQLPTFHSLRHINLASLFLSLGYTSIVVGACINAGLSKNAPSRDYSLESSGFSKAAIFGNGILPEIQATLAPPATGKMVKGLLMCYTVIVLTFYPAAVSGYWTFGNKSNSNIIKSLMPDEGPSLAPTWVLGLGVIFVLLQLFAIGLVYSQVAYEIMEKKSADVKQGMFSKRNLIPRLILRTLYMIFCGFMAAMLPFFGDINGVVGAVGFIPLDFVLPMLLYNMTYKPPKSSLTYWVNLSIMVVFTGAGLMGAFSSVRKLILDASKFKLFSSNVVD
ncbi:GABA TRANSPORTER 2 ISOFORM X1-RELATED [Salix purpurea]|uniref:GABA TRANSPORTER 2 ISOFORM X1-RELATED n=1 Tax=Salix purpurea TaxID=77065 RepID=A0A9Q0QF22_SALPP|nr:GABA TRANSPORTER 2 ISOFORM X1-RELATED [Salix purpurea]